MSKIKGLILTCIFLHSACFSYSQSSENYFQNLFKSLNDSPIKEWVKIEKSESKPCYEKQFSQTALIKELSTQGLDLNEEKKLTWYDFFCKNKNNTSLLIALSEAYFPFTDSILKANNLPLSFRFLPVALSAMNIKAEWKSGAGLWHLYIPYMANSGLIVTPEFDERLDPNKAALPAISRLKDLFIRNKSIKKTLVEYTFGPFKDKNQTNSYNEEDFLEAYTAIVYLFENKELLGFPESKFEIPETEQFSLTTTIDVTKEKLPFNAQVIALLNPANVSGFYKAGETIIVLKENVKEFEVWLENFNLDQKEKPVAEEKTFHKVKSGDTLSGIAYKYGVEINEIMKWNNLKSSQIFADQELIIYRK